MEVKIPIWILIAMGITAIVVLGLGMVVLVLLRNARTAQGAAARGKYPQGHWMSVGMCIGIAIGLLPSLAGIFLVDMSSWAAIAPAMGLEMNMAIGAGLEHKHKDELRLLTPEEQRVRFRIAAIVLGVLALLALSLFVLKGISLFAP